MPRRPLSPHLSVYRFGHTMSLSILHRFTGVALSLVMLVTTVLLVAAAGGRESWEGAAGVLPGVVWKVLAVPAVFAFVYHLANGIRHLCWDAGLGLERAQARSSARTVVIATVVVTALLVWLVWRSGAAS